MNDGQIYRILAKRPDVLAQFIADTLDCDLAPISALLRDLVAGGTVVAHSGAGPNGQPARMYNLSEEFKASRPGQELLAAFRVEARNAETAAATPPIMVNYDPAAPAVGKNLDVQVTNQGATVKWDRLPADAGIRVTENRRKEREKAVTKVSLAIARLRLGSATDQEMRDAMGLPRGAAVRAYLTNALAGNRVTHAEGRWSLGEALIGRREEPADQLVGKKVTGIIMDELHEQATETPTQKFMNKMVHVGAWPTTGPEYTTTGFRCALWTDGVLEIHREEGVVRLTPAQTEELARLLHRDWEPV